MRNESSVWRSGRPLPSAPAPGPRWRGIWVATSTAIALIGLLAGSSGTRSDAVAAPVDSEIVADIDPSTTLTAAPTSSVPVPTAAETTTTTTEFVPTEPETFPSTVADIVVAPSPVEAGSSARIDVTCVNPTIDVDNRSFVEVNQGDTEIVVFNPVRSDTLGELSVTWEVPADLAPGIYTVSAACNTGTDVIGSPVEEIFELDITITSPTPDPVLDTLPETE